MRTFKRLCLLLVFIGVGLTIYLNRPSAETTVSAKEVTWTDTHQWVLLVAFLVVVPAIGILFLWGLNRWTNKRNSPRSATTPPPPAGGTPTASATTATTTPTPGPMQGAWAWITEEKRWVALWIVIAFFVLHITLRSLLPDFWTAWWQQRGFLGYQIVTGVGVYLSSQKRLALQVPGWIIFTLGMIGTTMNIVAAIGPDSPPKPKPASVSSKQEYRPSQDAPKFSPFTVAPQYRAPLPPTKNVEGEKRVRDAFENGIGGLKGYGKGPEIEEMVDIAHRESDFNQFEADGVTVYRRRPTKDNPETDDVCALQVNEIWWQRELDKYGDKNEYNIRSYNLNEWNGCLTASLYLRRKYGSWLWTTSAMTRYTKFSVTVTAPAGMPDDWSDQVPATKYRHMVWKYVGLLEMETSEGQKFTLNSNTVGSLDFGVDPKWIRFRSLTGEPVTVIVLQ